MFEGIVGWFVSHKEFLLSFDFLSFVIFIFLLTGYLIYHRKDLTIQKMISIPYGEDEVVSKPEEKKETDSKERDNKESSKAVEKDSKAVSGSEKDNKTSSESEKDNKKAKKSNKDNKTATISNKDNKTVRSSKKKKDIAKPIEEKSISPTNSGDEEKNITEVEASKDGEPEVRKKEIPILYMALFRKKWGIKFINWFGDNFRTLVRIFGYISIAIGFLGIAFIVYVLFQIVFKIFSAPEVQNKDLGLILPFMDVPGIGYLSFWHWFIAIFTLMVIHEFAHAIVARSHDLETKNTGIGAVCLAVPLVPVAFVEPDEEKMKKAKDSVKLSILSAGPSINIITGILIGLFLVFIFTPFMYDPIFNENVEPVGVQFNVQDNMTYPANTAGLKSGMIMTHIEGKSVADPNVLYNITGEFEVGDTITVTVIEDIDSRDSPKDYELTLVESSDTPGKAIMGIFSIQQKGHIIEGKENIVGIIDWIRMLLFWLFLIHLGVGFANLIPIPIADGGQMALIVVKKVVKDEKKTLKIFGYISLAFLFILILGIFSTYVGNPIGMIKNLFGF